MWHKILVEGVEPFLKNRKRADFFYISLSEFKGDHIRLILVVLEEHSVLLATDLDDYFRSFFEKKPSPNRMDLISTESLYQDFENNTIHYGVYDFSIMDNWTMPIANYLQNLAATLLEVFRHYKQETLINHIEIMIEFFTIYINVAILDIRLARNFFNELLESEYKEYSKGSISNIVEINKANFENNKSLILQYLSDNIYKNNNQYDKKWEQKWYETVSVFSKQHSTFFGKENSKEHFKIIHLLCDAFNFEEKISAFYLLSKGLESFDETQSHET